MDDLTALRIKVAEKLGWTDIQRLSYPPHYLGHHPRYEMTQIVPDWPNDPGAAARDLLPEIDKRGWTYWIDTTKHGVNELWVCIWNGNQLLADVKVTKSPKAVALALCRAFVAADEAGKERGT